MLGVVIIIAVLVLLGPIAIMLAGAAWAALIGWTVGDEADQRAEGQPA